MSLRRLRATQATRIRDRVFDPSDQNAPMPSLALRHLVAVFVSDATALAREPRVQSRLTERCDCRDVETLEKLQQLTVSVRIGMYAIRNHTHRNASQLVCAVRE